MRRVKLKICFLNLFILAFCLTGCGSLKTSNEVEEWVRHEYGEKATVVEESLSNDHNEFEMYCKRRDLHFTVTSAFEDFDPTGLNFGRLPSTSSDFFQALTDQIKPAVLEIEEKYGIEFWIDTEGDGRIAGIRINQEEITESYLNTLEDAILELSKVLDFPNRSFARKYGPIKIENLADLSMDWYVRLGDETVRFHDSVEEFYKHLGIPRDIEEQVLAYLQSIFHERHFTILERVENRADGTTGPSSNISIVVADDMGTYYQCMLDVDSCKAYMKDTPVLTLRDMSDLLEIFQRMEHPSPDQELA